MCEPEPIPEVLHSAFEEGPFTRCVSCGGDLTDRMYQIQKAWRNGEVVFELAVCIECAADTMREFSAESMQRMQSFFSERFNPTGDLESCHFCGKERTAEMEYELGAACQSGQILRPIVLVCGECSAASQDNLSQKTRDAWGDFVDRNLPGVPESLAPEPVPLTF